MLAILSFLTDFADQAVVLPAAVAVALAFAATAWWRGVIGWSVAMAGTLGIMLLLKIGGLMLTGAHGGHVLSPSGHTACAGILYGGLAALLLWRRLPGLLLVLPAFLVVSVIGFTRVELHAHTIAEALIGGLFGCLGAGAFIAVAGPPSRRVAVWSAVLASAGAALVFHGDHLPVEAAIRRAVLSR